MTQMDLFQETSISSQPVSLASHFQKVDAGMGQKMIAISGRTCCELLRQSDRLGSFSRMFMASSHWDSTRFSFRWRPQATQSGHLLFRLRRSVRGMRGNASGLWATPRTTDGTGGARRLGPDGRRISLSNPDQTFGANLADQVRMWPTPRASEFKDVGPVGSASHYHMKGKEYLCAEVKDPSQPTGKLNPEWTEWLMGYPIGWTE